MYSSSRAARRCLASHRWVYFMPKSSMMMQKVTLRVVCDHIPGMCSYGTYPCVAKWAASWLYAKIPAYDRPYMPRLISTRTNPLRKRSSI
jgi:hypothetical protein